MSAELEIRLVDASPSEQRAMDQPLPQPQSAAQQAQNNQAAQDQAALQQVISVTELVEELRRHTTPISVAESSQQLSNQTTSTQPADPTANPPAYSSNRDRSINSVGELRNEITDLLGRHLPDAISQPLVGLINKFSSILNLIVPRSIQDRASQAIIGGARAVAGEAWDRFASTGIGQQVAGTAVGQIVGRTIGSNVAGAAARTAGTAAAGAAASSGVATAGAAGAGGAAAGAAGAVAAIAPPVAIAVAAIGALAAGAYFTAKALKNAAEDIEDISPAIAALKAQREITSELNRLDRANRLSGNLAQIGGASNRFQDEMERLGTGILEALSRFAPLMEFGVDSLTAIIATLNFLSQNAENIAAKLDPGFVFDDQKEKVEAQQAFSRMQQAWSNVFESNAPTPDQLRMDFDRFLTQQTNFQQMQRQNAPRQVP